MNTKILFIHSPFPVNHRHKLVLPISISQIASFLRDNNKNVDLSLLDAHINVLTEEDILEYIAEKKPEIIGFGYWTCQAPFVFNLSKKIKESYPEITLIHGGIHASFSFKETLDYCDVVVIGEGEKTFSDLIYAKQNNLNLENIRGIVFKNKGKIIKTAPQFPLINLDELPLPAYDLFDLNKYIKGNLRELHVIGGKRMPLFSSRGCPYNCNFCLSPKMWGKNVRWKSVQKVINEIIHLNKSYGFTRFQFYDDNFLLNRSFVEELCEKILQSGSDIKWVALSRAIHVIENQDLLLKMKKAGCVGVEMGLETADDYILEKINKEQKINLIDKAVILQREAGLKPLYTAMVFCSGETISSISKFRDYIEKKIPESVEYSFFSPIKFISLGQFFTPYPGSDFFNNHLEEGMVLSLNWEDFFHHQINFLPNSLLEDIPIRTGRLDDKVIDDCLKVAEISLFRYFTGNQNQDEYNKELMERVCKRFFSLIDGKRKIIEISQLVSDEDNIELATILRFIALNTIVLAQEKKISSLTQ